MRSLRRAGRPGITLIPDFLTVALVIVPTMLLFVLRGKSLWYLGGVLLVLYVVFLVVANLTPLWRVLGAPRRTRERGTHTTSHEDDK